MSQIHEIFLKYVGVYFTRPLLVGLRKLDFLISLFSNFGNSGNDTILLSFVDYSDWIFGIFVE